MHTAQSVPRTGRSYFCNKLSRTELLFLMIIGNSGSAPSSTHCEIFRGILEPEVQQSSFISCDECRSIFSTHNHTMNGWKLH